MKTSSGEASGATPAGRRSRVLILLSLGVFMALLGAIGFWWMSAARDEQQIREVLETRAAALEQKDLSRYLACFSPDYQSGSRTYSDLKADASGWFERFASIRFAFHTLDIQVQDASAIVENEYTFSVTDAEGETIQIAKRELLELRREQQAWKIVKALTLE